MSILKGFSFKLFFYHVISLIRLFFGGIMKTIKLSCAHALFKYLIAQKTIIDGKKLPLFPGAFAIYGHGMWLV